MVWGLASLEEKSEEEGLRYYRRFKNKTKQNQIKAKDYKIFYIAI